MAPHRVRRSALLPYGRPELFAMVADVERYPEFLPWCDAVDVLSRDDAEVTARVWVGARGMRQSFVTRNRLHEPERIELSLVEGPSERFEGAWAFTALGDDAEGDAGCKVELDLAFEFARRNPLLRRTFGALFETAAATMVESFCARAHALHGRGRA